MLWKLRDNFSIRGEELGPIVQYQDLLQIFPYNDEIYRVFVSGEQLRRMMLHILRDEAFEEGDHTEFYQFSRGFRAEYDRAKKELVSLSLNGYEIRDFDQFKLGLQSFHLKNIGDFLNVPLEEVSFPRRPKVISTNSTDILEEYFSHQELIRVSEEHRLVLR
ncbi:MAG: 5'-nucleotidase C-terminal domain-containing protein [Oscillospiraceae bacterium]|nr:5'-nucleotidase C-terminal domain-containing protein [Oscillospiraceae bacterium]